MKKNIFKILFVIVIVSGSAQQVFAKSAEKIKIHLPREVVIQDSNISLGEIGILRADSAIVNSINDITLGRLSVPGQTIVIDRNTILSRLASNGIKKRRILFSGAKAVSVKRKSETITADDYVKAAEDFLKRNLNSKNLRWYLIKKPTDTHIDFSGDDYSLKTYFDRFSNEYQKRVIVQILNDGKTIDKQCVIFGLQYKCSQAVAKTDIPKGTVISPENIELRDIYRNRPDTNFRMPFGLVAVRDIKAGDTIKSNHISKPKPEKIIKRNDTIIVSISTDGMSLTVPGRAMQDGYLGDIIKVKVQVTKEARTIVARVRENGTVEPIL